MICRLAVAFGVGCLAAPADHECQCQWALRPIAAGQFARRFGIARMDGCRRLVYRLAYNSDGVAFKMGRRQGARREHISIDT